MDCGVGTGISTKQSQDVKSNRIQKNRNDEEVKDKEEREERANDYIERGEKKRQGEDSVAASIVPVSDDQADQS